MIFIVLRLGSCGVADQTQRESVEGCGPGERGKVQLDKVQCSDRRTRGMDVWEASRNRKGAGDRELEGRCSNIVS